MPAAELAVGAGGATSGWLPGSGYLCGQSAIGEELSRLASHIAQMRACLDEDGAVGRRLDFLTQEMNREVNTIGSKASDLEITQAVVAAKSEIEKLREQVQNVE